VGKVIQDKAGMTFSYIAGLIPKEECMRFKRLLFRRTRGNVVTVLHDLEVPIETFDKKKVDKTLYVVIFRESDVLRQGVTRVCEAFSADMY
jgi:V-type H+-transporting ATPase subunit a